MSKKQNKKIDWISIFNFLWLCPMGIGLITLFLKLVGVLPYSWLIASSPLIFSYAFFACVMFYLAFFAQKFEKYFKK